MKESDKSIFLKRIRKSIGRQYDMPDVENIDAVTYGDPVAKFAETSEAVGGKVVFVKEGEDLNTLIRGLCPDAAEIASNVEGITIATRNPDTAGAAQELNNTDVAVLKGEVAVAENGCVWIPQTMKERIVCFISEQLFIIVDRNSIVSNMHEAYARIGMTGYGYGCFISGPSKTADIAQALVMGAQAARAVTVLIV